MRKLFVGSLLMLAVSVAMMHWSSAPASGQFKAGKKTAPKGQPAPRTADGKVDFSGVYYPPGRGPGDSGVSYSHDIARDYDKTQEVPMLPWAKELVHKRLDQDLSKDDPEGFCLPMGTPRINPYPWKLVQNDKLMVILYEGNVHQFRQVFLDGRKHDDSVKETWWGDSTGTWDGDALVIDTVGLGFGDGRSNLSWLDATGHPRTNRLHVTERYTRPELAKLVNEITIDDPGAYTKPWKVTEVSQLAPALEVEETICNENQDAKGQNLDAQHLLSLPAGIGKK
jgi:hypothetical protein